MFNKEVVNAKIVTLFLLIFSFSGINSPEPAFANNNSGYNINNMNDIKNISVVKNNLNSKNNSVSNKVKARKSLLTTLSKNRPMSAKFKRDAIKIMNAIKWHESRNKYTLKSKYSSACGAYQYIKSTWNNYGGYSTACKAPKSVQDQRMFNELYQRYIDKNGDWEKVIAAHFYPAWSDKKYLWHRSPGRGNGTIWEYVNKVMNTAGLK